MHKENLVTPTKQRNKRNFIYYYLFILLSRFSYLLLLWYQKWLIGFGKSNKNKVIERNVLSVIWVLWTKLMQCNASKICEVTQMYQNKETQLCRNKIPSDCVYQAGESWDLFHNNPAEILNFGGADVWNSMPGIFSCSIQISVR